MQAITISIQSRSIVCLFLRWLPRPLGCCPITHLPVLTHSYMPPRVIHRAVLPPFCLFCCYPVVSVYVWYVCMYLCMHSRHDVMALSIMKRVMTTAQSTTNNERGRFSLAHQSRLETPPQSLAESVATPLRLELEASKSILITTG